MSQASLESFTVKPRKQVAETSKTAYHEVSVNLGAKQEFVFNWMKNNGDCNFTNNEISKHLKIPINQVTPRMFELREMGLVVFATKRACTVTGRTCNAWIYNKPVDTTPEKEIEIRMQY